MGRYNYLGAMRRNWLPLMDADGGSGGGGGAEGGSEGGAGGRTYTEEEFQAEIDRRVTAALKKQKKKSEEENAEKIKEAQRLAQMDADERYRYELEQREKQIAEKETELALAENKAECAKILSGKGLDAELVDLVVDADAETMNARITLLDKHFKASVKAEVEKRLAGAPPKKGSGFSDTLTREEFMKMSIAEQQKLYNENPELYRSLIKR